MKSLGLVFTLLVFVANVTFAQLTPEITSWKINTTGAKGYNNIPSNMQQIQYSTNNVYVSATCIPDYDIGPWNSNPNTPVNKNFVFKITRNPTINNGTKTVTPLGHIGVWSNGVSIFNAKDGMSYNNAGVWNRDALFFEGISFDECLGHPAPGGEYHHHVNPKCLYDDTDSTHHSPIIGYAFDGFPIYGAYGYTNTDGTGAIKRMKSSYVKNTYTTRTNGPAVNATYPIGAFIEDFTYTSGAGDLDIYNGRFCKTPDYPNGIYAYFVTIDATLYPVYPYVLGPSYYGTVQTGNTGPNSGHVTVSESVVTYKSVTLSVSTNTITLQNIENSSATFGVSSNTDWVASCDSSWIKLDKTSGTNNGVITASANINKSTSVRTATIKVSASGANTQYILVNQAGGDIYFSISPKMLVFNANGSYSDPIEVMSNSSWTITKKDSWVHVDKDMGSNSATINVTVDTNFIAEDIYSSLSFINEKEKINEKVTIIQYAALKQLSVSPSELIIDYMENSKEYFDVKSNTDWNVSSTQQWLTVGVGAGKGNAQVELTASENNTNKERKAVVNVYLFGSVGSSTISVTQKAGIAGIEDDNNILDFEISPNPVSSIVNIATNIPDGFQTTITLTNIKGEVLLVKEIVNTTNTTQLDLSNFASGEYFIEVKNNSMKKIKKIIIRK